MLALREPEETLEPLLLPLSEPESESRERFAFEVPVLFDCSSRCLSKA